MIDPKKVAEDATKRIFDACEAAGRVIHADDMRKAIEDAIQAAMPAPTPVWGYAITLSGGVANGRLCNDGIGALSGGTQVASLLRPEEWR